ncbi:MAG TPA: hypothetical protein VFP36_02925 [Usitatibacter sp.]|nr:hypothetical protein [Usitatibacter sp.]
MSKVSTLRDLVEVSGAQLESGVNLAERDKPSRRLTGFVFSEAAEEVNKALATVDVQDVFAHGWAKARALWSAANASRGNAKPTVVALGEHDLKYSCSPVVELKAGDEALPEIRLTFELSAHFRKVEVSLADGKVTAISPGSAAVVARLKHGATLLVEKTTPNARVSSTIRPEPPLDVS